MEGVEESVNPKTYQMNVYDPTIWFQIDLSYLKRKKKEQPLQTSCVFTFKTVISSVLNEAGKLTSIFGFQQARYDEREADCRPGR